MKAHLVRKAEVAPRDLAGMALTRDIRGPAGERAFAKGHVLREDDVPALLALDWEELHVVEREAGEIEEDEAGRRLANAAAGAGISLDDDDSSGTKVGSVSGGHWPITAVHRGLLRVDVERLVEANRIDGICIYTLYDGQVVDAGETVARAKITPFVIDERNVEQVERIAREAGGLVRVRRFRPAAVAAVVQESLGERALDRFRDALAEKIAWFGARLMELEFVAASGSALAGAIEKVAGDGAEVVIIAGAKAMDPLDPAFGALEELGVQVDNFGVPAHPGSLFWTARLGEIPVLGMPSCGLFSRATSFDLVLPRVLAGERIGPAELATFGHGGLITKDTAFRFPRYREATVRGEMEAG
jgi:molybdopterin biosynthesis enzyme